VLALYNSQSSTCSQKVRLCLAEKGLEYREHRLNTLADEHLQPAYLALNPNGVVPTLVHDGKPVIDSSVICEYVEEIHPEPPLMPRDALGRARLRAWMRFAEEVPTQAIRVPSFHQALAGRFRGLDNERFAAAAARRPLRKHMYRRMGQHGFSPEEVQAALEQLDLTLQRMEVLLASGPWLMGESFTLADILVIPTIDRMADLGHAARWSKLPGVASWYARVQQRPSFQAAYYKGSRLSERIEVSPLAC
jgi:glutathione S-transferase